MEPWVSQGVGPVSETEIIRVGYLEVRAREHVVLVRGDEVALSNREFQIVRTLAGHPGWVFSAGQLSGESGEGEYSPESVSVLVSRLRHKLATAGASGVVETVRGAGYRLHPSRVAHGGPPEDAEVSRELWDASWQLQEAVIEVERSGSTDEQRAAIESLELAHKAITAKPGK
jgi:DNA-binding winged helix-turn-helix (wHTH) protein